MRRPLPLPVPAPASRAPRIQTRIQTRKRKRPVPSDDSKEDQLDYSEQDQADDAEDQVEEASDESPELKQASASELEEDKDIKQHPRKQQGPEKVALGLEPKMLESIAELSCVPFSRQTWIDQVLYNDNLVYSM